MKEFGKLTIKKDTVVKLDEIKNIKGGAESWPDISWTCHIKKGMSTASPYNCNQQ